MLNLHEPEFQGLRKIISGGQVGADQGGLEAAFNMNIETGGHAPFGFRTQTGPDLKLSSRYNLVEHPSFSYPPRTRVNIEQSNGTIIIASNMASPGCTLTAQHALKIKKPLYRLVIARGYTCEWLQAQVQPITAWIIKHRIEILNVAGNRDMFSDTHHFNTTDTLLTWVFLDLQKHKAIVAKML